MIDSEERKKMPTEQEIRDWVRTENEKIVSEKQESCGHRQSGTLNEKGESVCDQCNHIITDEDYGRYVIR